MVSPRSRKDERSRLRVFLLAGAVLLALVVLIAARGGHQEAVQKICGSWDPSQSGSNPQLSSLAFHPYDLPSGTARVHYADDINVVPRLASNLDDFLRELKVSLDIKQLKDRPVDLIFDTKFFYSDMPHPACSGLWMEFGVFTGGSLNRTAIFKERYCGVDSGPVFGFDTFTGLPEKWADDFAEGSFSLNGDLPFVRDNAELVKGLFSVSLPPWIEEQKRKHGGNLPPITYLHIDCDLYAGAKDALTLLMDSLAPGCILIFDELLHYPTYKEHEVKALWEYLRTTKRKLYVVGIMGPMHPSIPQQAVDLSGKEFHNQYSASHQSAAFILI